LEASRRKSPRFLQAGAWVSILALAVTFESRTAFLQSETWSHLASLLRYTVAAGPSERIVPASKGPFDDRLGYSRLPQIAGRLESRGYSIAEQARFSPELVFAAHLGVTPP